MGNLFGRHSGAYRTIMPSPSDSETTYQMAEDAQPTPVNQGCLEDALSDHLASSEGSSQCSGNFSASSDCQPGAETATKSSNSYPVGIDFLRNRLSES